MKSVQTPKNPNAPQTTLFLKPAFSVTVLSSQMSVQVTAQPVQPLVPVRS
jgi:hypothetical protein